MSDGHSYGHWHDLRVTEVVLIDMGRGHEPPDPAERVEHHLSHPPQCGRACRTCASHPHCDIEGQVNEFGPQVAYGGELKPGAYKVRTWYHRTPSGPWGDAEYDSGIEVCSVEDFDETPEVSA